MDFTSPEFWSALVSIVIIDLVLAGDNAIVIGLAARNLAKEQQKKVIFWGTFGAIFIRSLLTFAVVWLLKIPGLLLIGGLLLVWIAYKLLTEGKGHDHKAGSTIWDAIKMIVIADTVMGLDNVLAVAGAAHGSFTLVVLGLLISVPIVVWGSTLILKWIERFPVIIYLGSAVLAWTAAKMIQGEPFLAPFFASNQLASWGLVIVLVGGVLFLGRTRNKQKQSAKVH